MIDSAIFIGLIVVAVTQAIKYVAPQVSGIITMLVACVVGALVAVVDTNIGVVDITVAQGIMIALGGVGAHTLASAVNTTPTPKV